MFSDEATFHVSGKVNKQNVRIWESENPHATVEHIRDSPKVNVWCGLLHYRLIGSFVFAVATVTSRNYLDMLNPLSIHSYKNCRMPCSSTKTAHHHTGAWLCVHLSISISQTDWLAVLVPSFGRPDHRVSHPVFFFPMGIRKRLRASKPGGRHQLFEGQNLSCYCDSWRWHDAAYMDGAWISLGHCTCDKWCPFWMRVIFRTNFESFSRRWRSNSVSMSFHKGFIHE
jgi:hypothetical protein